MRTRPMVVGAAVLAAVWSGKVWGQSVLDNGGFPGNWGAASAPPAVPMTNLGSGTANATTVKYPSAPGDDQGGLLLLGGTVTFAQQSGSGETFTRVVITREQRFTLLEGANVALPTFLNGAFNVTPGSVGAGGVPNLGGGIGLISSLAAKGDVHVYDPAGNSLLHASVVRQPNQTTTERFTYVNGALPAGAYTVRSVLTLEGTATPTAMANPPTFTQVTMDFTTGTRNGLATSLAAYPAGLGDSRASVTGPAARNEFRVTGAGVIVGVFEPGEVYTNHAFLNGRVATVNPAAGAVAGNFDDEHTLAVAGIIAGEPGNGGAAGDRGMAPGAEILSSSFSRYGANTRIQAITDLYDNGARVINMSAFSNALTPAAINTFINGHADLVFVKSAGNNGGAVTSPGTATNIITVGALNRDFTRKTGFSSFTAAGFPVKPDLVAPGEYVNSLVSRDINGDMLINDTQRHFLGDDYNKGGPTVGAITGTSFAAPHVSGAAALLQELAFNRGADDNWKVIKAVLLNSASRTGLFHADGTTAWNQDPAAAPTALEHTITRSMDRELGAGKLDTRRALRNYFPAEVRGADNNTDAHLKLDAQPTINSTGYKSFWDREVAAARVNAMEPGTVDYLLEDITLAPLRATLVFGTTNAGDLNNLELLLFKEGVSDFNTRGFGMGAEEEDFLIARTNSIGEAVKLFDFIVPDLSLGGPSLYYLQVRNTNTVAVEYGIAVFVPEPGALLLLSLPLAMLGRRR